MRRPISIPPSAPSEGVLEEARAVLERLSGRTYDRDTTKEALHNLTRLVLLVQRWEEEDAQRASQAAAAEQHTGSSTDQREEP
jgi:hypothetical protein